MVTYSRLCAKLFIGYLIDLIDHTREEFQRREVTCTRVVQLSQQPVGI